MASLTQCTWVWVDSWSWWWTGKLGVLQFMGSQRVGRNWVTELNWRAHRSFAKPTYYNQFLEIFILWPVFLIKQRKKVLSRWLLCLLTSLTAFWTLLQFLTWKKWQLFFLNDILVLFFFSTVQPSSVPAAYCQRPGNGSGPDLLWNGTLWEAQGDEPAINPNPCMGELSRLDLMWLAGFVNLLVS